MERESFEDERIAALMNQLFVCIKVDREERPDLDEIYMPATRGLEPRTRWLADDRLFDTGTTTIFRGHLFPSDRTLGSAGLSDLLNKIAEYWDRAARAPASGSRSHGSLTA